MAKGLPGVDARGIASAAIIVSAIELIVRGGLKGSVGTTFSRLISAGANPSIVSTIWLSIGLTTVALI